MIKSVHYINFINPKTLTTFYVSEHVNLWFIWQLSVANCARRTTTRRLYCVWSLMSRWPLRSTFCDLIFSFVLPILKYCYAVWCSAADSHIKLKYRVVSDSIFSRRGVTVQPCPPTIWGSVVQCACYLRSNVTQCILWAVHFLWRTCPHVDKGRHVADRQSFTPPRSRTSQYRRTFVSLSEILWN